MIRLIVQSGENIGQEYTLQDSTVMGRLSSNPVCIDDHLASREHCKIVKETDGYYIIDLGSRNGTRVNGRKIKTHKLTSGNVIKVGHVELRFETDEEVKPEATVEPTQSVTDSPTEQVQKERKLLRRKQETASTKILYFILALAFFVLVVFLSKPVGYSIMSRTFGG